MYVRGETIYTHRSSSLSDRKNTLLVMQLLQPGCITKDIVISKVPHEIRDLHYTRKTKCKVKGGVQGKKKNLLRRTNSLCRKTK